MRNHYILCGLGKVGGRVLEYLCAAGLPVVVVDDRRAEGDSRLLGQTLVVGDCRQEAVLEKAGVREAAGVLIMPSDDIVCLSTALMVRHLNPMVRVVVRMFNPNLLQRLGVMMDNVAALSASALAAPLLASIARTGEAFGVFMLDGNEAQQFAEVNIDADSPLVGKPLEYLSQPPVAAVVLHQPAGQQRRLFDELEPHTIVRPGDRLVVCGNPELLASMVGKRDRENLPDLLWGNLARRLWRVLHGAWTQIDLPLKVCGGIFFGTIFVSMLVFTFGMKDDTLIDAFYRTISLMATGADMHGDDAGKGTWQKGFISALRLIGVALTAAFTAILTHYLIRANLKGVFEVRRIPEGGHIVVCGLGNVGFRVVQELLRQGEPVVVLERNADNAFVAPARRLGAAVIIGNATLPEVLAQAHAASARAVVAATSNELVNVEISLFVREMQPKQRVVVRVTDPHLGQTLRTAANVRLAMSIPDLVAPAFVAPLLGDQIRGLFLVEGKLVVARDVAVDEQHARLRDVPLGELRRRYRFLPLRYFGADGKTRPLDPDARLQAGERLTILVGLEHLQSLLGRETAGR